MNVKSTYIGLGLATCLWLSGCASPPKAPTLSGSNRTPVNTQTQIDLQGCKSDLNNTRIILAESVRYAENASKTLEQVTSSCTSPRLAPSIAPQAALQAPLRTATYQPQTVVATASTVFVVYFNYASTTINLVDEGAMGLTEAARKASLIMVRGRTDGVQERPGEARVARERAYAAKEYLVALGVSPSIIRTTYQAVGDYAADNTSEAGRALNRRVEIEIYNTAPTFLTLNQLGAT